MKIVETLIIGLCVNMALLSCTKDEDSIGSKLIDNPNSIGAEVIDFHEIITFNAVEDSIQTSERTNPVIGSLNTEQTGITSGSAYITLLPDTLDQTFPSSNFTIESFTLNLHIVEYYGDNQTQEFEVYKVNSSVNSDTTYYHFDNLQLGDYLGAFTLENIDSGIYSFPLDLNAGELLMSPSLKDYETNDDFVNFFPGICILSKSNPALNTGTVYKLNRTGVSLELNYTTEDPTDDFDKTIVYQIEKDNYLFTEFNHDISGSALEANLSDTALDMELFYVQGMGSCLGKFTFPTVQNWFTNDSSNFIINKFQVDFFAEENAVFNLPEELILTYTNTDGVRSFKSGFINSENQSYTFTLSPNNMNQLLENKLFQSANFSIEHPQSGSGGELVSLNGPNSIKPPVLTISYTKY